jgi:hypothetical protein
MNKRLALKISSIALLLAGIMDIWRGFVHTFQVKYATINGAGIEPNSDNLVLMGAFGISNFLTGFLYLLIVWKVKKIVPYVLLLIPVSYCMGSLGLKYSNVLIDPNKFKGQYIMSVYLGICVITVIFYFLIAIVNNQKDKD